jgi:RecG-like helicase
LHYTTQTAIELRLSKRLQVGGLPSAFGKAELQLELLDLIVPQCEARFEALLEPLYQVPLILSTEQARAIAASIVEKMILSEVLPVQINAETGAESGLRKLMADEWAREVKQVQLGEVRLSGERVASSQSYPFSNSTLVVQRGNLNPKAAESIQW